MKNSAKIMMLIIILLAFGGIIYAVTNSLKKECSGESHYDPDQNACIPTCQPGEKYYPSTSQCLKCAPGFVEDPACGCIRLCAEGERQCGCDCITLEEKCINNKPCNEAQVCENEKSCCGRGKYCDRSAIPKCADGYTLSKDDKGCYWCGDKDGNLCTVNTNKGSCGQKYCISGTEVESSVQVCKSCGEDHIACLGQCCVPGQVCTENGCCHPGDVCKDPKTGKKTCCVRGTCCNGKCCKAPDDKGNATMLCCDNKCKISCSGTKSCDDTTCDLEKGELCFEDKLKGKDKYACYSKHCQWNHAIENPPDEGTRTCATDNTGKVRVFCTGGADEPAGSYQKTSTVEATAGPCSDNDCRKRLGDIDGVAKVKWDKSTGGLGVCSATWDCNSYLPECTGDCPFKEKDDGDDKGDATRCCGSEGKYTGRICPQGTHCATAEDGSEVCTAGFVCDYTKGYLCDPLPAGEAIPTWVKKVYPTRQQCTDLSPGGCRCGPHGERWFDHKITERDTLCKCKDGWRGILCKIPPKSGQCYGAGWRTQRNTGKLGEQGGTTCGGNYKKFYACGRPRTGDDYGTQRDKCTARDDKKGTWSGSSNFMYQDLDGKLYPGFTCKFNKVWDGNTCYLDGTGAPTFTEREWNMYPDVEKADLRSPKQANLPGWVYRPGAKPPSS